MIGIVSVGAGLAIWLGWRKGGWAYEMETKKYDLD
jgi:hypothetical protein